jgi:hypothetical protein
MTASKICNWILLSLLFFPTLLWVSDSFSQETTREGISYQPETEKKISGGASIDFVSKYIWRGIPLSDGPVLQSDGWIKAYGAQVLLWGNLDLSEGSLNEIDLQTSYHYQWKNLSVEPTLLFYFFHGQGGEPPTGEAGFKLSYALGPVQLTTGHAFDFMEFGGAYFGAFSASYEREFTSYFSLETDAGFGWANSQFNEAYFGVPHGALNYAQWNIAFTFSPLPHLFFSPHLKVSVLTDSRLREQVSSPTNVVGGLQLGADF